MFSAFLHFGSVTNDVLSRFERWVWANVYKGCHDVTDAIFRGRFEADFLATEAGILGIMRMGVRFGPICSDGTGSFYFELL